VDGLDFKLTSVPEMLKAGRDYQLGLTVHDSTGRPASLEEVMGARGHLVAFDGEGKGFAHMHPLESVATLSAGLSSSEPEGDLEFMFNVPNPGWYRLFAQIQVEGRAVFGRFDLKVE